MKTVVARRRARLALLREAASLRPQVWRWDERPCVDACAELAHVLGPMSYGEIGILLGFSREHARQLEHRAIAKLRRAHPELVEHLLRKSGASWDTWNVEGETAAENGF